MPDVRMRSGEGSEVALSGGEIARLQERLEGELIHPGDYAYEAARAVWNGMIDRRPALIVRASTEDDVVAGVTLAREHGILLSVRGGGHNVAGYGTNDGGLLIDLGPMNEVRVDSETGTIRVGGGATLGDLDRATQAYGLVVPTGIVSETGVGGLTLGGGYGWLRGKYGLTCDNLVAADVVAADGRTLRADEGEHADLFWGLRGGGGNFGIVTSFEFRSHRLGPAVYMAAVFHDGSQADEVLRFWRDYCAAAPDEVSTLASCGQFPPGADAYPEEVLGLPFVAIIGVYAGPPDEGARAMAPLREFREPLVDFSGVTTWLDAQRFFDEDYPAHQLRYYWKSTNLPALTDAAIQRIVDRFAAQPSPLSTVDLWHVGGAVRRADPSQSAFAGRNAAFLLNVEANWAEPEADETNISWARALVNEIQPFSDGSRYFNFPGFDEEGDTIMEDTFGAKYPRLAALKTKFDPTNLFRLNSNIKPLVG